MTGSAPARPGWLFAPYMPLYVGLFFSFLGIGASLTTIPFFVLRTLRRDSVAVGTAVALLSLAVVIARPVAGRLADRYGYKLIMLVGALTCAVAGALYAVASSFELVLAVRVLHGIGEALTFQAGLTWMAAIVPQDRRGQLMGLLGVAMWSGITLGGITAPLIMQAAGFAPVWVFCALTPLIGLAVIASKPKPDQKYANTRHAIFPPSALIPGIALALASAGYVALASFVALHLAQRGIVNGIVAFNAFGFTYVGVRLKWGRLSDTVGPYRVALWSGLVEALGLLLVGIAPNLVVAVIGGLVTGAGLSLLFPALTLVVMDNTEKAQHGTALGMYTSFWDLGLAAGAPLAGFIAGLWGYPAIYFVMMGLAVVSGLLGSQKAVQQRFVASLHPAAQGGPGSA